MNNPARALAQRRYEAPLLERLGGRTEGQRAFEVGCGRGVGTEIIFERFGAREVHALDLDPEMVGLARTIGETEGFIKVIRDKRYDELAGAHLVGPNASELIAEFVVGRYLETTVEEMARAVYAHPTLSDAVPEAALAAFGRAIHI